MKIIFVQLFLFFSITNYSQTSIGIFGGPQATGVRYMVDGEKQESSNKYGINLGMQLKFPVEKRLSFSPSVMYNLRGYNVKLKKQAYPPDLQAIDNSTSFHTIELAFLLQHDFTLEPGHAFFRFGPSLDFALFGNESYNTTQNTVDRKMKWGFGDYGHYLASAIVQLGLETANGMFIYGHYNYSLGSMNNADGGPKIGNRAVGISFGWFLKNKKIVLDTRNKI